MHSTRSSCRATDVRELGQQSHHTLELVQEAVREVGAAFVAVEPRRFKKVILSAPMENVHRQI